MYHLLYAVLYIFSLLPWRVLYLISDAAYLLVYYVVRYRRKVVADNLLNAFPEKSAAERKQIEKKFYKLFFDNFIEVIKLLFISEQSLKKRFTSNIEVMNNLVDTVPNVSLVSAHFFNWEFVNLAVSIQTRFSLLTVYKPVDSPAFEKLMYNMRKKFGAKLIPSTHFTRGFIPHARTKYALGLVADQSPGDMRHVYWLPFFGRLTAFVKGPEKMSKSNKSAVVYLHFYRVKRGFYKLDFQLVTTDPNSYADGHLTRELVKITEEAIRRQPANYLWSHRRWKYPFDPTLYSGVVE
jgi:Kdo2-lipid IVA lauroyltransferase/acyltransferase